MLLADSTPTANTIWIAVVALSGVMGNFAQLVIARRMAARQQADVRLVADPVSREHCEAITAANVTQLKNFQKQLDEYRESRRVDVNDLHKKVNTAAQDVAAVKASVDMLSNRFDQVEASISNLPDRVIATLKNTGAI
jgi:uncharacterized phage infection (PIP) family protein YhgE